MRLVGLLVFVACSGGETRQHREVTGTLSLDGKTVDITACRAGRGVTTYVELVTARGKLRFEDKQLFWSTNTDFGRGDKLECDKLERSWGGGSRKDGTSYFRGHLIFTCKGPPGALAGDVTVDCGRITAEERESLDKNRQDMLKEQAEANQDRCEAVAKRDAELFTSPGHKPIAFTACREDRWPLAIQDCMIAAPDIAAWDACQTPEVRAGIERRR